VCQMIWYFCMAYQLTKLIVSVSRMIRISVRSPINIWVCRSNWSWEHNLCSASLNAPQLCMPLGLRNSLVILRWLEKWLWFYFGQLYDGKINWSLTPRRPIQVLWVVPKLYEKGKHMSWKCNTVHIFKILLD
jgi:hypothetical protein